MAQSTQQYEERIGQAEMGNALKEKMLEAQQKAGERQINITFDTNPSENKELIRFTSTFKALLVEAPQQTATVVTECGALVVVVLEAMWHVNLETLLLELQTHRTLLNPTK